MQYILTEDEYFKLKNASIPHEYWHKLYREAIINLRKDCRFKPEVLNFIDESFKKTGIDFTEPPKTSPD